jgi:micrococcal nuclease
MRNLTILITLFVLIALVVSLITSYIKAPAPTSTPTPTSSPTATVTLPPRTTPTLSPSPTPSSTPTPTPTPTPSPTPTPMPSTIRVSKVVDGDTIDVLISGQTEKVRLIGIDTPEVYGGVECFGLEASAFTKSLLPVGTPVVLEKDVSERDSWDRLLSYVYLPDGRMLNEVLVAEGYAQVATYPPDVKYQERFLGAQRIARELCLGLWGACGSECTPTPTPTQTATPTPTTSSTPTTLPTSTPTPTSPQTLA